MTHFREMTRLTRFSRKSHRSDIGEFLKSRVTCVTRHGPEGLKGHDHAHAPARPEGAKINGRMGRHGTVSQMPYEAFP